jgi:uncharacterized membrane-anchored protein
MVRGGQRTCPATQDACRAALTGRVRKTFEAVAVDVVDEGTGTPVDPRADASLGLRMAVTVIERAGGRVVTNRTDATVFTLLLPATNPGPGSDQHRPTGARGDDAVRSWYGQNSGWSGGVQDHTFTVEAMTTTAARTQARLMLNKVPEVTVYFWLIKILCTTVGESFADYINETLGFGLTNTTILFGAAFAIVLFFQFRLDRYVPGVYWLTVVLVSVFGTLVTDNLTDGHNVPLWFSSLLFSVLLAVVFSIWYARERTLSIHTIITTPREAWYWTAVLVTFALGTAVGDWTIELTGWGPGQSVLLPLALILAVLTTWRLGWTGPVLSFWVAYILTRPLGANIGDFLASPKADGGLGLGTLGTSVLFLGAILATVVFLTITGRDRTENVQALETATTPSDSAPAGQVGAPQATDAEPVGSGAPRRAAAGPATKSGMATSNQLADGTTGMHRVLVVTDVAEPSPTLREAIRHRALTHDAQFRLVVINPARAEAHLLHPERHDKALEAEAVVRAALPTLEADAGGPVIGSVSVRHDPMDAIEETMHNEPVDEILIDVPPHHLSSMLHQDLEHRLGHLHIPVVTVRHDHG